ncbi:MAG: HlyD family type I secretion periplasmic adaptor subunit [Desulfovibrio sp.]|nr:HlyD family type I secretion periplasmic adaptor subunit [Desulfovibrio sp.]MBI4958438.1 HlyD family type I secretion periplasmic adaptor subunit [Desulfovibrio sp.]
MTEPSRPPAKRGESSPKAHGFASFQSDALEIESRPIPVRARFVLYLSAFFFLAALAWACIARMDMVVSATGKLVSGEKNMVVQPMESVVVKEVLVSVGQRVVRDQPLAILDPTFAEAGFEEQAKRRRSLAAQVWRLGCETSGTCPPPDGLAPEEVSAQREIMLKRQAENASRVNALNRSIAELEARIQTNRTAEEQARKQVAISQDLEAMYQDVFKQGASSKLEYMKAQSAKIEAESQRKKFANEALELKQSLERAKAELQTFNSSWVGGAMKELVDARRELDQVEERERKASRLKDLIVLKAPQAGIVLELGKYAAGAVVAQGETVAILVPLDGALEAEAEVRASDIGYIREGDKTRIKVEAFPFQRHGVLDGTVRTVSADAFEKDSPEGRQLMYRTRIALQGANLRAVPADMRLIPGMTLTAEIKVGSRRVITYLLYPVIRSLDETMREP